MPSSTSPCAQPTSLWCQRDKHTNTRRNSDNKASNTKSALSKRPHRINSKGRTPRQRTQLTTLLSPGTAAQRKRKGPHHQDPRGQPHRQTSKQRHNPADQQQERTGKRRRDTDLTRKELARTVSLPAGNQCMKCGLTMRCPKAPTYAETHKKTTKH